MFQQRNNLFTPIRSTIGKAIQIGEMSVIFSSDEAKELGIDDNNILCEPRVQYSEAANDPRLLDFWPEIVDERILAGNTTYKVDTNQPNLIAPDPVRSPFPDDAPYRSIFALATSNSNDPGISRKLTVRFQLRFKNPELVGGIAFSGYPSLGYTIDKFGRTSSNFGLPREMRISIASLQGLNTSESLFIDADLHYTKQVINYSSGFHFFHVEPTQTKEFTLQMSDFPLLMKKVIIGDSSLKYAQAYGLVIPYLYVYTYQEKAHYHHHVPGGVIGTLGKKDDVTNNSFKQDYLSPIWQRLIPQGSGNNRVNRYQVFPGSSIFRAKRMYEDVNLDRDRFIAREQFVSDPIDPGDKVSLICEQCDETLRSIAGMRLIIPVFDPETSPDTKDRLELKAGLPSREVNIFDKVRIKIYELDFPSGVSPLDAQEADLRKYKHLLAEKTVTRDDLDNLPTDGTAHHDHRSIRFKRASNQQYFEIELENLGTQPGNAVIYSAELIQSAHITLHPKLSRRLQVSRMHFRIVGSDLVEDYAQIGTHGFNFSIERLSGGQPIQQLIAIRSLADLMQSGMARIMSNSRRRAIEFEKSNSYLYTEEDGPRTSPHAKAFPEEANRHNYESRYVQTKNGGWSKVESGEGVTIGDNPIGESYASQEVRTHIEHLYPYTNGFSPDPKYSVPGLIDVNDVSTPWEAAANYLNIGHGFFTDTIGTIGDWFIGENSALIPGPDLVNEQPANPLGSNFEAYWKGLVPPEEPEKIPIVAGMKNVSMSPFSPIAIAHEGVTKLYTGLYQGWQALVNTHNTVFNPSSSNDNEPPPPFDLAALINIGGDMAQAGQLWTALVPPATPAGVLGAIGFNAGNGFNLGGSLGFIGGVSTGSNLITPGFTYSHSFGSQGTITKSASKTGYMKSETVRETIDEGLVETLIQGSEHKRIVERRAVPDTDKKRIKGAEIMWQKELKDIILGTVPLNISFPAMAERSAIPVDEALRVRFGNGIGEDIEADFWFEISETEVRDDF